MTSLLFKSAPKRSLTFAIVVVLLLVRAPAQAYDPSVHETLSGAALRQYGRCYPADRFLVSASARSHVVQGDRGMDEGRTAMLKGLGYNVRDRQGLKGGQVFDLKERLLNWHFYNPDRTRFSRIGLVEQSFVRLWEGLRKGFVQNKKEQHRLLFLGGLLHLVEDVSVPAHVIPVYHGPASVGLLGPKHLKPLVQYMRDAGRTTGSGADEAIRDPIDSFPVDARLDAAQLCPGEQEDVRTPEEVRDELARKVLSLVRTEIPGCAGARWEAFWNMPSGDSYFGTYATNSGMPQFGEAGSIAGKNGSVCRMEKDDPRYREFAGQLHREAVRAGIRVLRWGARELERAGNAGGN